MDLAKWVRDASTSRAAVEHGVQLGTRVRHQTWSGGGFGDGTVVALGTYKGVPSAAVRFDNGDQKLLAEPYAPLRAI